MYQEMYACHVSMCVCMLYVSIDNMKDVDFEGRLYLTRLVECRLAFRALSVRAVLRMFLVNPFQCGFRTFPALRNFLSPFCQRFLVEFLHLFLVLACPGGAGYTGGRVVRSSHEDWSNRQIQSQPEFCRYITSRKAVCFGHAITFTPPLSSQVRLVVGARRERNCLAWRHGRVPQHSSFLDQAVLLQP